MAEMVVYTAIIGGYDILHAPAVVNPDVQYVCFTDKPLPKTLPWEQIIVARTCGNAAREGHRLKVLAHKYFPDAGVTLWIDGSVGLNIDPMVLLDQVLQDCDIAVCAHPPRLSRDCIYQEGQVCVERGLGVPSLILKQLAAYREQGYPEHNGLAGLTLILRRHTKEIRDLCETWWAQIEKHNSRSDQLSFPFVCWLANIKYGYLPLRIQGRLSWRLFHHVKQREAVESDQAVARALATPGCFTEIDLRLLYRFASQAPAEKPFIELGVFRGRTSVLLSVVAEWLGSPLFSVDNFVSDPAFKTSTKSPAEIKAAVQKDLDLRGCKAMVIRSDSAIIPPQVTEVGLLFIDTEHTAKQLKLELDTWLPLLEEGSILVFHDYLDVLWPDIKLVVDDRIISRGGWRTLGVGDVLIGFMKDSRARPPRVLAQPFASPAQGPRPSASVVILTYSHPQNLGAIVNALRGQDCEIIIADDGLGVFHPEDFDTPVKIYTHERTMSRRASTRNGGARLAVADNLIFLDDDALPSPWLVEEHCRALRDMDASEGGLTVRRWDMDFDMRFRHHRFQAPSGGPVRDMFWSANLGIRRRVFEELGGFDSRYDGEYGYEDTDLATTLTRHFKRIYWNPEAMARNLNPSGQWGHSEGRTNRMRYDKKWSWPRVFSKERVLIVTPGFSYAPMELADGFSRALYYRGFDTQIFDLGTLLIELGQRIMPGGENREAEIINLASDQLGPAILCTDPDWVLVIQGTRIHKATWMMLKGLQVRVGLVLTESPYLDGVQRKFAPYADVVFCNERDSVEQYHNGYYLPASFDKFTHRIRRVPARFRSEVLLAMNTTPERDAFVTAMDWDGVDMRFIGHWGYPYRHQLYVNQGPESIPNPELARWYNRASIGLNIYRSEQGSSLNPRAYEMAACGCFQLTTPRGELGLFDDSVGITASAYEMERMIRYYLRHDDERQDMAEEAMRKIEGCSFDDRVEILIQRMRGE